MPNLLLCSFVFAKNSIYRLIYAAEHAVSAEPNLTESQTSMGIVNFFLDRDWPAAEMAFRKAIALDPSIMLFPPK